MISKFSITTKISILVALFVAITSLGLNYIYAKGNETLLVEQATRSLQQEATVFQYPLGAKIDQLKWDTRFLNHTPPIQGLIRAKKNNGYDQLDKSTQEQWIIRLSTIFSEMLAIRPDYIQLRYIGLVNNGKELLRVDRVNGVIKPIPETELQENGSRSYFKQTVNLQNNQVYLSEVELNKEHGEISEPHTPVIRAGTPVYDEEGNVFGIIIINANFTSMLRGVEKHIAQNRLLYIANQKGSYVYHDDPSKLYADDLQHTQRIQNDFPEIFELSPQQKQNFHTILPKNKNNGLITSFHRFHYNDLNKDAYLSIILKAPYKEVAGPIEKVERKGFYLTLAVACVVICMAIFLLRLIVHPLKQIAVAMVRYRRGEKHIALPDAPNDEVGILSREFQTLMDKKRDEDWIKENLVRISNVMLEFRDFEALTAVLMTDLAALANAQLGALYVNNKFLDPDAPNDQQELIYTGGYGITEKDNISKKIKFGDGLVGQAALDKTMKLVDVKPDFAEHISTSLTTISPSHIIILPVVYKHDLAGVIELASVKPFTPAQKAILEQLCFNIGAIIRDIAATANTQRLLKETQKAAAELTRSNKELDDFAYIASHDLKEPLRGLFNNARFLQEDYQNKLDAEGVSMLERMQYLSQRMEQLVNDLLYFSRLGRQALAVQKTDIKAVIDDIATTMQETIQAENIALKTQENLPTITCDKPKVTELFRNLISNAIKYNDNSQKYIEIGFKKSVNRNNTTEDNVFYVRDNGIGIKKEFQNDVFRIFKRLNEEDDTKRGTGVGLTFVKKIVERHSGTIWIDSSLGQGTTFYFTLKSQPLPDRTEQEETQPTSLKLSA